MVACVPYTLCGTRGGGSHTYHTVVDGVSKLHFHNSRENKTVMESLILKTPFPQSSGWLCFFISLLIPFWLIHFFHVRLFTNHIEALVQATCAQSHHGQSRSAVALTTCEVQVSAADSQTVNSLKSCWFWNQHHQQHQQQQHRYDNCKPIVAN